MRGDKALIAMRQSGFVPDYVFINVSPDRLTQADDWQHMNSRTAHLELDPTDRVSRMDMRCVRGLRCYVEGEEQAKVEAMREACVAVGAARVIAAVMERRGSGEFVAFRVRHLSDTAGHLVRDEQGAVNA